MAKRKRQTQGAAAKRRQRRGRQEAMGTEGLPALETLHDLPAFSDMRIDDAQRAAFGEARAASEVPGEMHLGVVIRLDRGFPLVTCEDACFRAEHGVAFAKQNKEKDEGLLPAVGDAVMVRRASGHDMGVIKRVLPRRTSFERWRGKNRGQRQVLCANLDTVLIVAALGAGEVLLDRIARSLILARDCGAEPAVILTKADRCTHEEREVELGRVRELVGPDVRVVVTSSVDKDGLEAARACVPAQTCALILGESGVGKSTLLNALLGYDALATGAVRERDDMGRHTTVARVMVKLPGEAGVIADAPGLRSLPLVGHERGLARTFSEIVEASRGCRFNDCSHTHEPGCAVREALEAGEINAVRLDEFLLLAREMRVSAQSLDPDIHI